MGWQSRNVFVLTSNLTRLYCGGVMQLHLMAMVFGKPTAAKMRIEQVSVLEWAKSKSSIGLAEDP